ncbi:MAG: response regulator [Chloroflexi bacterium]|uniref:Response regulator n=1 Tax=Candidatus Chlorohelix allophototropha TaxID=3003348 RepID=A0A8T7M6I1_9CHLR|nr:response regulator [Chloroflexota bacterium]WJW69626.1 response regulator [Chloroflexota bacterium L227-S17]
MSELIKVLVIDDDPIIRELVSTSLKFMGYEPFTASNGKAAFDIFQRELPQLVFVDKRLPGLSGDSIVEQLREWNPNLYIVTVSGECVPLNGSKGVLQKPFTNNQLLEVLENASNYIYTDSSF